MTSSVHTRFFPRLMPTSYGAPYPPIHPYFVSKIYIKQASCWARDSETPASAQGGRAATSNKRRHDDRAATRGLADDLDPTVRLLHTGSAPIPSSASISTDVDLGAEEGAKLHVDVLIVLVPIGANGEDPGVLSTCAKSCSRGCSTRRTGSGPLSRARSTAPTASIPA